MTKITEYYNRNTLLNEFNYIKTIIKNNDCMYKFEVKEKDFLMDWVLLQKFKIGKYPIIETFKKEKGYIYITLLDNINTKKIKDEYQKNKIEFEVKEEPKKEHIKEDLKKEKGADEINEKHYKVKNIEPLDVIDEYDLDFYLGNVVKYVLRSKYKGTEKEDLLKAKRYIDLYLDRKLK